MRSPNATALDTSPRHPATDQLPNGSRIPHDIEQQLAGYQHRRHQLERQHDLWSRRLDLADLTAKIDAIEGDLETSEQDSGASDEAERRAELGRLDAEIRDCQLVLALAKAQHRPTDSILQHAATIRQLGARREEIATLFTRWRRLDDERTKRRDALDHAWQALDLPTDVHRDHVAAWRAPLATTTRRRLAAARDRCGDLVQLCRGLNAERSHRFRQITEASKLDWWTAARAAAAFGLLTVGGLLGFLGSVATGWLTSLLATSLIVAMVVGIRWRRPHGDAASRAVDELAEIDAALRGCTASRNALPILGRLERVRTDFARLLRKLDLPTPPVGAGWPDRLGTWHALLGALVEREQLRHRARAVEADLVGHEQAANHLADALGLDQPKRGELGPWIDRLEERLGRARAADTVSPSRLALRQAKARLLQLETRRRKLLEDPTPVDPAAADAARREHRRQQHARVEELRRLAEEDAAMLGLRDWRRAADLWDKPVVRTKRARLRRRLESTRRAIADLRRSGILGSQSAERSLPDYHTRPVSLA
ncbi:MAG: hypothetical protein AAGE94_16135 [Acidobacteriota bacterium]